ncbi:MAG: 50S ribosomal protein L21 [Desulfarculales bacterium]|jgi:large subunit ribosomal protein L21|nr:50S ribosomal protein L21 [Desulfarculales bacterium]
MYAIIMSGGKQYKVEEGQVLRLEKIDAALGDQITLTPVLLIATADGEPQIGRPFVDGAEVKAKITEQGKSRKIMIMKKKRRKGYRVKRGHRQHFTAVRIESIAA